MKGGLGMGGMEELEVEVIVRVRLVRVEGLLGLGSGWLGFGGIVGEGMKGCG